MPSSAVPPASSNTVFIESGTGIGEAPGPDLPIWCRVRCFSLRCSFAPLASIVPTEVAGAALVIVGR